MTTFLYAICIIFITIGCLLCFKGDCSKYNTSAGAGGRIPSIIQSESNQPSKKLPSNNENPGKYYKNHNIFQNNKFGIILLLIGIILFIVLSIFL